MAEHRWTSNVAASWAATGSWHDATVPANDDIVLFGKFGKGSVTGGLDQTLVNLTRLDIDDKYPGDIATSGSPLRITADRVIHRGSGAIHLKGEHASKVIEAVIFDINQRGGITTQSTLDGSLKHIIGDSGNVLIKATAAQITSLHVTGRRMFFNLADTSTALISLTIDAGEVSSSRTTTGTVSASGGILTLKRDLQGSGTTPLIVHGGTVIFEVSALDTADSGPVFVLGGTLDMSDFTFGKSFQSVVIGRGAVVIDPSSFLTVTGQFVDLREELA